MVAGYFHLSFNYKNKFGFAIDFPCVLWYTNTKDVSKGKIVSIKLEAYRSILAIATISAVLFPILIHLINPLLSWKIAFAIGDSAVLVYCASLIVAVKYCKI